ncbi:GntR family transcriptional regulator [Amycolatopsis lurida]
MLISVDPSSTVQLADQVAQSVRAGLASGAIRAGDRLPPARQVASALGIGLHTVLRGYQQLRDEGLVELRRGRGAIITDAAESVQAQLGQLAREFIGSVRRIGLDDEQTLELVRDALRGGGAGKPAHAP